MTDRCWLVTGGAGYIGAHVVRALLESGRQVVVLDDFSSGLATRLPSGVEQLRGSVTDTDFVVDALRATAPDGVMHLAGRKSPPQSLSEPLLYARENVGGTLALLTAIRETARVRRVVFSSSAAVYGNPVTGVVGESAPLAPLTPYGESKVYGEQLMAAAARAHGLGVISLRYFNVVGAATPALADTCTANLIPQVLAALRTHLPPLVYGADYPTPDGTCIRDFVDVRDVADAHVRAADALEQRTVTATYNVGRGEGSSVLQVLDAISAATGSTVAHRVVGRRAGDPAEVVGRVELIARELGWSARHSLSDMISSACTAQLAQLPAQHVDEPA